MKMKRDNGTFIGLCVATVPNKLDPSSIFDDKVTQCFVKLAKSLKQQLSDQLYSVADPVFMTPLSHCSWTECEINTPGAPNIGLRFVCLQLITVRHHTGQKTLGAKTIQHFNFKQGLVFIC